MVVDLHDVTAVGRDHLVRFYERDAELTDWVGDVVLDATRTGDAAIVIATAVHRRGLRERAAADGIDLAGAGREGRYAERDAAATLAAIMPSGRLDPDAFDRVVGTLVRDAAALGRPVRAFGEMVGLLWEAGDVPAALELERLWNDLGRELPFTLLCAYRHASVSSPEDVEALEQLCCLHSAVIPAGRAELVGRFAAEPDAPGRARRLALSLLVEQRLERSLVDDVQLVVTELATNAVLHARSAFTLTVAVEDGARVRISVADASDVLPGAREVPATSPSGRGLALVQALASSWGVEAQSDGKVVWAELAA